MTLYQVLFNAEIKFIFLLKIFCQQTKKPRYLRGFKYSFNYELFFYYFKIDFHFNIFVKTHISSIGAKVFYFFS